MPVRTPRGQILSVLVCAAIGAAALLSSTTMPGAVTGDRERRPSTTQAAPEAASTVNVRDGSTAVILRETVELPPSPDDTATRANIPTTALTNRPPSDGSAHSLPGRRGPDDVPTLPARPDSPSPGNFELRNPDGATGDQAESQDQPGGHGHGPNITGSGSPAPDHRGPVGPRPASTPPSPLPSLSCKPPVCPPVKFPETPFVPFPAANPSQHGDGGTHCLGQPQSAPCEGPQPHEHTEPQRSEPLHRTLETPRGSLPQPPHGDN